VSDPRQQWGSELAPTPECIAIERLGEERTGPEREHLATCPRCQAEMALFDEFNADNASADEIRDGQWIAAELQRRLAPPANVKQFQPRVRAYRGLAAAAAAVIVIGTGYWFENREPSIDTQLGGETIYRTSKLEAIAPLGDVPEAPHALQWTAVAGANAYTVRILEVDQTLLWSADTSGAAITLPADVIARFAPGKTLLWDVTARRGSNVIASSGMQRFRVALSPSGSPRP
jgi:hypothetical protein